MPYSDNRKKKEHAKSLTAPACNEADIANYKSKHDHSGVITFIHEAWEANGSYQMKNIYANPAAMHYADCTREELDTSGIKFRTLIMTNEESAIAEAMFNSLHLPQNRGKTLERIILCNTKTGEEKLMVCQYSLLKYAPCRAHNLMQWSLIPVSDEMLMDRRLLKKQAEVTFRKKKHLYDALRPEEQQTLRLIALGCSTEKIAVALRKSEYNINDYKKNLRKKLKLNKSESLECFACSVALCL